MSVVCDVVSDEEADVVKVDDAVCILVCVWVVDVVDVVVDVCCNEVGNVVKVDNTGWVRLGLSWSWCERVQVRVDYLSACHVITFKWNVVIVVEQNAVSCAWSACCYTACS